MKNETIVDDLLAFFPLIRYAAIYERDVLHSRQRDKIANSSSGESDKYEELLVNPALLVLAGQRGNIDCGGLRYLIVAYGSFYQLVVKTKGGHLSICLPQEVTPSEEGERILVFLQKNFQGLL